MSTLTFDPSLDASMRQGIGPAVQQPRPDGNQRLMWQREMERAETAAWFRQPPETPTEMSAGSSSKNEEPRREAPLSRGRQPVTSVDPSLGSERSFTSDRRVASSEANPARESSGERAQVGPTRPSDSSSTANGAVTRATGSHVAQGAPASDARRRMNATMNVAKSDRGPTALPARTLPQPPCPAGRNSAPAIDATTDRRLPDLQPASEMRPVASTTPPSMTPAANVGTLHAEVPSDVANNVVEVGTRAALQRAMQAATSRAAPVRIHIEWNGDAAAVWVGIDAAAEAALPGLIGYLAETLSRSGLRLRSVVCNGSRCIHGDATSADDQPRSTAVDIFMESES